MIDRQAQIEALEAQLQPLALDDTMSEAARKSLLADFIKMLKHEAGSRTGEDIEDVHDMRVATRRMRSTFALLEAYFKPKAIAPYQAGLKKTARALGDVRDLDVMIAAMQAYQQSLPVERKDDMQPVIDLLDRRRIAARKRLNAWLDKADYEKFLEKYSGFLTTPGVGANTNEDSAALQIRYRIPVIVFEHMADVRAYDAVLPATEVETLHALRIEFKRLRYLVSMYSDVLGTQVKDFTESLKKIQDHLGDLNDASVAQDQLSDLLPDLKKKQAKLIKEYIAALAEKETQLAASFPDVWRHFNTKTVQRQLATAVAGL